MTKDLASREGALAFIESMKDFVLNQFAREGKIPPHAIVFMTKTPDGDVVLDEETQKPSVALGWVYSYQMTNPRQKDGFTGFVAEFAEKTGALGIATIFEAWMARAEKPGANRADFPADFSNPFPGRMEGIMVLFEHVALEHPCEWWAEIKRTASGIGSTQPFVETRQHAGIPWAGSRSTGRFTHLLKRSAS